MGDLPGHFVPHDHLKAAQLNAMLDWMVERNVIRGGEFIVVSRGPGGWSLGLDLDAVRARLPQARLDIWAEITGASGDQYQWKEKIQTAVGTFADKVRGRTQDDSGYACEMQGRRGVPAGKVVRLWWDRLADGHHAWRFAAPASPNALFAVLVTQTGGVAGSDVATCSFTYGVTDLAGTALGAAMTPKRPRFTFVEYETPGAGSVGLGYYDNAGAFQLYEAVEERPKTSACP